MERRGSGTILVFASAGAADRRVAGVSTAARLVHQLLGTNGGSVMIALPDGATLAPASRRDIERVAFGTPVGLIGHSAIGAQPHSVAIVDAPRLDANAIFKATGKASDGLVSRWLNRPVSRRISAALLALDWVRPIHATLGTAVIAAAMFLALLFGGAGGALAGGLLFHAASVFDGVDGEIARATWRTSPAGARIDTMVDVATNLLFILGLTINLSAHTAAALPVGLWGFVLFAVGLMLLAAQAARVPGDFSLDLLKHRQGGALGPVLAKLMAFLTMVTGRDFFALLFALLILAGLPMAALWIFALAATLWFPTVAVSAVRQRRTGRDAVPLSGEDRPAPVRPVE